MSTSFQFHGFQRAPQTAPTRHTILLLMALNDAWKQEKAKHQLSRDFDPKHHFHKPTLLADLSRAVAPIIRKVLAPADVYAHLLYLSERKLSDSVVMVRNHPGNERPGEPIFQMGKAGEELCDIIDNRELRTFIESDAANWHAIVVYARLVEAGECSPSVWTPENLRTLTGGLTESQMHKALKALQTGFTSQSGDKTFTVPANSLLNEGTRRAPRLKLAASLRVSATPEVGDLDFEAPPSPATPTPPTNGRAAAAADAFARAFGPETPAEVEVEEALTRVEAEGVVTPPAPVPGNGALRPDMRANVNITKEDVAILQAEAARLKMSFDSLVTLIIKSGIEEIVQANKTRESEEDRARREAREREQQAILAEAEEAQRLADEAARKLAEVRRRQAALDAQPAP